RSRAPAAAIHSDEQSATTGRERTPSPLCGFSSMSSDATDAQGRLDHGPPIAVIDIGSNSVRLVVYEGLTRSPTPIFHEKGLAGLGREGHSTGLLAKDAVEKALAAIKRFRTLCDRIDVAQLLVIATAACRDAKNGKD